MAFAHLEIVMLMTFFRHSARIGALSFRNPFIAAAGALTEVRS